MSNPLWAIEDIQAATGGEMRGNACDVTGISIDSRTLKPGEGYFAILGDVHDGHKFVGAAHEAGASLCVVARGQLESWSGPLLIVDDVLAALEDLGRAARARATCPVIAVTGSVGKTTTKEAMRTAFEACGSVHASAASFNNHWGVPLTLARMPSDTAYGVFEIGMNHPGEITPLVGMVRPDIAIITNVAPVHLGAFDSVDAIARAKAEIFSGVVPGGTAVLNADDPRIAMLSGWAGEAGVANIVTFGEADGADVRLEKIVEKADCSCIDVDVMGTPMTLRVGTPGRHIVQNVLAVLAAVKLSGADLAKAGLALADLGAVKGRGQRHVLPWNGGNILLIDESYNANPASIAAALTMLDAGAGGRRIAVLGDMLELGSESRALHAGLANKVRATCDALYLVGAEMGALGEEVSGELPVIYGTDADELARMLARDLCAGDTVMVKASNSLRFARIVDYLVTKAAVGGDSG